MASSVLRFIAVALPLVGSVLSQSVTVHDYIPKCAVKCFADAILSETTCEVLDAQCHCLSDNLHVIAESATPCSVEACGDDATESMCTAHIFTPASAVITDRTRYPNRRGPPWRSCLLFRSQRLWLGLHSSSFPNPRLCSEPDVDRPGAHHLGIDYPGVDHDCSQLYHLTCDGQRCRNAVCQCGPVDGCFCWRSCPLLDKCCKHIISRKVTRGRMGFCYKGSVIFI